MNDIAPCEYANADAAYVLGALSAEERLEYERHLPGCKACSRAVQRFAGLPGLLAQVSPDVLEAEQLDPPVPDTLLPALVQEVRRTRQRRHWRVGLAAAAAVVVAALAAVGVVATGDGDDSPPPAAAQSTAPAREMAQVDQTSVWGTLSLTPIDWGTRLDLTCRYEAPAGGYGDGGGPPVYTLVVRGRDGGTEQVASWKGLPGEPVHVTGATARGSDEIAAVEVRTADGLAVLALED